MSKRLLPLIPAGLTVVQILPTPDRVTIVARPSAEAALCPDCSVPSHRLHSRYERQLFDLTWQGRPVALRVQARRFRRLAPSCPRQTFAERLTGVAASAARRTERLGEVQCCLGLALGGCSRSRLTERLAMPVTGLGFTGAYTTVRAWAGGAERGRAGQAMDRSDTKLQASRHHRDRWQSC